MDNYIKRLRQYVSDNLILFDVDCDHPALDSLYWHYGESYYMGNETTKAVNSELNDELACLSYDENNKVFSLVGALWLNMNGLHFWQGCVLECS